ncbi:MAG: transporter, partial [Solirubrobacterales bacterium]|nr:transporter [Solirubrobacterales bacterium]
VVNVALPDIAADLGSSFSDLQWVIDAYALSLAALLLTAGSLSDLLGRKRIFIMGLVLFTLASLLCGLASTPLLLEIARGLQGIGGAAMFATSLALLAATFQGKARGIAFGVWGATTGAAVAVGPLVGGVLTEHVSWQSIFFINVPIGAVAVAAASRYLGESKGPAARVDVPGLITFSGGLFLLIFALVRGNAEGWSSGLIVGFLIAAAVLLVAFVVVELRRADPMLDLSLFRKPAFAGAAVAAFALSASMFAMFLYLTLYIQLCLGFQPLDAGLRFLPITLLSFTVAPIAGRLSERMPVRYLLGGGLTLVGVGLLLMRGLDAGSEWTALLPGFVVAGAGIGMVNPPLASTAIGVVEAHRSGMASGINTTFRQVGIATGIAAFGAVFQSSLERRLPGGPPGEVLAGSGPSVLGPGRRAEFLTAYTSALNELLLIAGIVAVAGAVLALILVRPKDFVAHEAPGRAPAGAGAADPVAG